MKTPTTAPRTFTLDAVRPAQGGLTVRTGVTAGKPDDITVNKAKTADKAYTQMDAYIKQ